MRWGAGALRLAAWGSLALPLAAPAQTFRYPPNAGAVNCFHDPVGAASLPDLYGTTTVERVGPHRTRVRFTLTNYCATRVSVSGLEPATAPGAAIVEDAPIEVAAISESTTGGETTYVLSGTADLGVFDVPAGATVEREVEIRLTVGSADDVVAATAVTHARDGGAFYRHIGGDVFVEATGVGVRSVCVHYADRPCGAYQ